MSQYDKTKFYWLQLKEDFFEEDSIAWLEEQGPNGIDYAYFYLKLCLKSLKTNGFLIRRVGQILVPYDCEKLSEITRVDFDTVKTAMELLQRIGLVQILENGEIYLTQVENMIGSKSKGAFKKQQQRQSLGEADNCPPLCPPEIESDLEIESEIELDDRLIDNSNGDGKKLIDVLATDEYLNKIKFVQDSTTKYDIWFQNIGIYIDCSLNDISIIDKKDILKFKYAQEAVKYFYELGEFYILDKLNIWTIEKVLADVGKMDAAKIRKPLRYFITSLETKIINTANKNINGEL